MLGAGEGQRGGGSTTPTQTPSDRHAGPAASSPRGTSGPTAPAATTPTSLPSWGVPGPPAARLPATLEIGQPPSILNTRRSGQPQPVRTHPNAFGSSPKRTQGSCGGGNVVRTVGRGEGGGAPRPSAPLRPRPGAELRGVEPEHREPRRGPGSSVRRREGPRTWGLHGAVCIFSVHSFCIQSEMYKYIYIYINIYKCIHIPP